MSDQNQIELDLRAYVEAEGNLRRDDRIKYLMAIFQKHFQVNQLEHVVKFDDFQDILSIAKVKWPNQPMPMHITNKRVDNQEFHNVLLVDAVLNYLNKNHLLNKEVKIDFTNK